MKHISFILAIILTLSALVGCADKIGAPDITDTSDIEDNTTPPTIVEDMPYTPNEDEQGYIEQYYNDLCDRYNSDEYKSRYPVRSDLIWCDNRYIEDTYDDAEDYGLHPLIDLPHFDDDYKLPQTLRFDRNYEIIGSPYRQSVRDTYDHSSLFTSEISTSQIYAHNAAYAIFLSERKFVAVVNIWSDELSNATDKMEVLRAEEDYFESLGYEVIRNHSNYTHNTNSDKTECRALGEFIVVAFTKQQIDELSGHVGDFKARTPSTSYWAHTPCYSALGMYDE